MVRETGVDIVWGNLGNDTLTGGIGADTFHSFGAAGIDLVTMADNHILDYRVAGLAGRWQRPGPPGSRMPGSGPVPPRLGRRT